MIIVVLSVLGMIVGWFLGSPAAKNYPELAGLIKLTTALIGIVVGAAIGGIVSAVIKFRSERAHKDKYRI